MSAKGRRSRTLLNTMMPMALLPLLAEEIGALTTATGEVDIVCTSSGTVVGGYTRWLVLAEKGVIAVSVVVRDDLANLPRDVLGLHVLRNYLREIAAADGARARLFFVWDRWRKSLPATEPRSPRHRIGAAIQELLGVSHRTLLRRRAVQALGPGAVQELAALKLPGWALERIARLRAPRQGALLAELRGADDPREVLARYFPNFRSKRHKKAEDAVAAFARGLRTALEDLGEREHMAAQFAGPHATTLRDARRLIDILLGDATAEARP